jgi:hypothetical protein
MFGAKSTAYKTFSYVTVPVKSSSVYVEKLLTQLLPAYLASQKGDAKTTGYADDGGVSAMRRMDVSTLEDELPLLGRVLKALQGVRKFTDLPEKESGDKVTRDQAVAQYQFLGRIAQFFKKDQQPHRAVAFLNVQRAYGTMLTELGAPGIELPPVADTNTGAWEPVHARLVKNARPVNPTIVAFKNIDVGMAGGRQLIGDLLDNLIPRFIEGEQGKLKLEVANPDPDKRPDYYAVRRSLLDSRAVDIAFVNRVVAALAQVNSVQELKGDITPDSVRGAVLALERVQAFLQNERPQMAAPQDTVKVALGGLPALMERPALVAEVG